MARDVEEVVAVGVNCLDPADALGLVRFGRPQPRVAASPSVVYPNSGEQWDAGTLGPGPDRPASSAEDVQAWVDAGARLIGGCCRVTPDDIRALSENLRTL